MRIESTGKFYHHVKSSQDRRKQNIQSKSLKRETEQKKRANDIRDEILQQFEGQLEEFNKLKGECNEYKEKLSALCNEGIIDLEGEIVNRGGIEIREFRHVLEKMNMLLICQLHLLQ